MCHNSQAVALQTEAAICFKKWVVRRCQQFVEYKRGSIEIVDKGMVGSGADSQAGSRGTILIMVQKPNESLILLHTRLQSMSPATSQINVLKSVCEYAIKVNRPRIGYLQTLKRTHSLILLHSPQVECAFILTFCSIQYIKNTLEIAYA